MSTMAERIEDAIKTSGVRVSDVAAACGISVQAVYAWIRGEVQTLDGDNLAELAHLTGFEPRYLAKGVGPRIRVYARTTQEAHVLQIMQTSPEYSVTVTKIASAIAERAPGEMSGDQGIKKVA